MEIQTTTSGRRAFTLVEVFIVFAGIVLMAAILLPALAAAKRKGGPQCVNYLKMDTLAFKMWGNDNYGKYPTQISMTNGGAMEFAEKGIAFPIFQVMSNELSTPKILVCPMDTKRISATNFLVGFSDANISYFVGLGADEKSPNSILIGDDNFAVNDKPVSSGILNLSSNAVAEWSDERHHRAGNIAFADGSVQQMSIDGWRKLIETSAGTNRLVIP